MSKNCKHQNIIITYKARYHIPEGWTELMKKDDIDLVKTLLKRNK